MAPSPVTDEDLRAARHLGAELALISSTLLPMAPCRTAAIVEGLIDQAMAAARAAGLAGPHEAAAAAVDVEPGVRRCVLAGLMISLAMGTPGPSTAHVERRLVSA
jgi:hypothetical protein